MQADRRAPAQLVAQSDPIDDPGSPGTAAGCPARGNGRSRVPRPRAGAEYRPGAWTWVLRRPQNVPCVSDVGRLGWYNRGLAATADLPVGTGAGMASSSDGNDFDLPAYVEAMADQVESFATAVLSTIDADAARASPERWAAVCRFFAGCAHGASHTPGGGGRRMVEYFRSNFPPTSPLELMPSKEKLDGYWEFFDWLVYSRPFRPASRAAGKMIARSCQTAMPTSTLTGRCHTQDISAPPRERRSHRPGIGQEPGGVPAEPFALASPRASPPTGREETPLASQCCCSNFPG
jgi:hypothetical protein